MPSEASEKQDLIHEFVKTLTPQNTIEKIAIDIEKTYMQQRQEIGAVSEETYSDNVVHLSQKGNNELGYTWGDVEKGVNALKQETIKDFQLKSIDVNTGHSKVDLQYQERKASSDSSIETPLNQHFWDEASSLNLVRSTLKSGLTKIASPTFSHGTRAVHQELYGNAPENP